MGKLNTYANAMLIIVHIQILKIFYFPINS
jgi:hypothetical protein